MIPFHTLLLAVVIGGFTVAGLLALIRIVTGPTILDRIVATDMLLTTLMLAVGAEMVVNSHTDTIPLMVVLAATSVFATIMVARYVKRRNNSQAPEETERQHV